MSVIEGVLSCAPLCSACAQGGRGRRAVRAPRKFPEEGAASGIPGVLRYVRGSITSWFGDGGRWRRGRRLGGWDLAQNTARPPAARCACWAFGRRRGEREQGRPGIGVLGGWLFAATN